MHALITGGAGFIGSHLADALLARGDRVTVLDDLSTGRSENLAQCDGKSGFEFIRGTILDANRIDRLVAASDVVYHLAAAVGVQLVVSHPLEALKTNVHGSEIVLEAAARYKKKTLLASTSEIYGKNAAGALCEDDDRILGSPLKSRWGYSAAKAIDELLGYTLWKEQGLPIVIARLFNVVGPRQTGAYGMVIPRMVAQALKGEPLTIYGTGAQSRCFLHVADAVAAFLLLMNNDHALGQVFNVGSREEITIEDLARRIIALTKSSSTIIHIPYEQAYDEGFEEMMRRVPSTARLEALTGWRQRTDLEGVLRAVIADHSV